jgi:phosphoribosylamine---glycine ligase
VRLLLIGSGGREHALAFKLAQSPLLETLFAAPGNPGIAEHAQLVGINVANNSEVVSFCQEMQIDLVVVGPETPLVAGLADALMAANITVFGPTVAAAQLEGSKGFTKDLCTEFNIPTAAYSRFNNAPAAKAYVRQKGAPIVIKADGIAAGKGVVVAMTELNAIDACFEGAFGDSGAHVVVEEFMSGEEISFFCICDGETALPFETAQDHKRVGNGDTGSNTGGMGAYSPASIVTPQVHNHIMKTIIEPTMSGMKERGTPFSGVLFAGIMLTSEGPKLIEYNTRFGDPECQVLLMRLQSDLLPALLAASTQKLHDVKLIWHKNAALTVVMAAIGYPDAPQKGSIIKGIGAAELHDGVRVFHAGTALQGCNIIAAGGRVLNVSAIGKSVKEAQQKAYDALDEIDWPQGFYRSDIGWREVEREDHAD